MNRLNTQSRTILLVVADPLIPISGGGAARVFKMTDYLREVGFRVELATPFPGLRALRQLRRKVDRVWTVREPWPIVLETLKGLLPRALSGPITRPIDRHIRRGYKKRRSEIVSGDLTSFVIRKINPALCSLVEKITRAAPPRAVLCQYAWTAMALDAVPAGTIGIVDTIDIQHQRRGRAQDAGSDLPGHKCTREEEVRELSRADVLLAIQRHESVLLKELCPDRTVCLAEHAVEPSTHLKSPPESLNVFCVGSLYDPNVLGMKAFVEIAWPKIRRAVPGSTLTICGRVCEGFHDPADGVRYLGRVADLAPYYRDAAVVINPVPYGSGLKIKSVEALAFGKCLVSTPSGVYGLEDDQAPFIVAPVEEMAGPIIDLLKSPEARSRREIESWNYAKKRFAPKSVYRDLERLLRNGRS